MLGEDTIERVSIILDSMICPAADGTITDFDWNIPIPTVDYVARVCYFLRELGDEFVMQFICIAIIYMRRLTDVAITRANVLRLFTIGCILSNKCHDDESLSNASWTRFMHTNNEVIRDLEVWFYKSIRWNFYVDETEYYTLEKEILPNNNVCIR